jgi:aminopeptidase N
MKAFTVLFFLMFMMTGTFLAQVSPPIEAGVSPALAKWRTANYSDVRYKLSITLAKSAPLMRGEIEIRVSLTETGAKNDLVLDWRTTQFQSDKDKPVVDVLSINEDLAYAAAVEKEHLIIPKALLKKGENVIVVKFASPIKTSGAGIKRYVDKEDGAEYVYSLFAPSDASTAFPVFDQPDLKAKFSLILMMPEGWKAVSNTNPSNAPRRTEFGGRKIRTINLVSFAETKPISTNLFAFAAGDFMEFSDLSDTPPVKTAPAGSTIIYEPFRDPNAPKIYVRKSQTAKFQPRAKEVFRLNRSKDIKTNIVIMPEILDAQTEFEGLKFLSESSVYR